MLAHYADGKGCKYLATGRVAQYKSQVCCHDMLLEGAASMWPPSVCLNMFAMYALFALYAMSNVCYVCFLMLALYADGRHSKLSGHLACPLLCYLGMLAQ